MKISIASIIVFAGLVFFGCSKSETASQSNSGSQNASDTSFAFSFDVGSTHYQYTGAVLSSAVVGGSTVAKYDLKDSTFKFSPGVIQMVSGSIKIGSIAYKDIDFQFLNSANTRYCWGKSQSSSTVYSNTGSFTITSSAASGRYISGKFSGYFHAFYTPSDSIYITNGTFKGLKTLTPVL